MESLLTSWGLQSLIPSFQAKEITLTHALNFNEEELTSLIPSRGLRIHFTDSLQKYQQESGQRHNSEETLNVSDIDKVQVSPADILGALFEDNIPANQDTIDIEIDNSITPLEIANCITPLSSRSVASSSGSSTFNNVTENDNSEFLIVPTVNRTVSFYGANNLWAQDYEKLFPEFDLRTLLNLAPHGGRILNYYSQNNRLTESLRNKLVDIIISHVYPYILKHRLTHSQYNTLCSKIITLFPNESPQTYYFSGKRINNLAVPAKGKLVNKAQNILHLSPDKTYVRKRKLNSNDDHELTKKKRTFTDGETDAVTWLKHNREPWDVVLQKWNLTFDIRQVGDYTKVTDLVSNWPVLSDPRADCLIEADFSKLHPGTELNLLKQWDVFYEKVISLKKAEINETRDPVLQSIIESLNSEQNLTEDSKVALQIASLPRIFPPKGRSKVGKDHWKYTTAESVEGFIVHATTPGDIERKVNSQIEKALKRKIQREVQPYLLVEGPLLTEVRNTYVVIDKIHFHANSALKGLDTLFKSFFALNIKYPVQTEHIWYAIQSIFFQIPVPEHKITGNITDLIKLNLEQ